MSYVIRKLEDGKYYQGRSGITKDLQRARVYLRIVDAMNSVGGGLMDTVEIIPVRILEE